MLSLLLSSMALLPLITLRLLSLAIGDFKATRAGREREWGTDGSWASCLCRWRCYVCAQTHTRTRLCQHTERRAVGVRDYIAGHANTHLCWPLSSP
jgi:hypothetical protein